MARGPQPDDAARRPARPGDPARAARRERSWLVRAPLVRRGHFRIEPLQIRTGDPFGFFEASATVGQGVAVVVYPRIERIPLWRLPAANVEGAKAAPERTLQTTPLATTVRPWAPGDASTGSTGGRPPATARSRSRSSTSSRRPTPGSSSTSTARSRRGRGDESTVEVAVRVAAAVADKAILENRAVGHDGQRPSDRDPAGRPRRPPAPQGHAAPRRGRWRRRDAARRDARPDRRPPPPGHDRDPHHRLDGRDVDPARGRAPVARHRDAWS